jgi:hypothetical protein
MALAMALPLASLATDIDYVPESPQAGSRESDEVQDYTRAVGKAWLKSALNIDVDDLTWRLKQSVTMDKREASGEDGGAAGEALAAAAAASADLPNAVLYNMNLSFEEYDDLRRLQSDFRDIPFALKMSADAGLIHEKIRVHTTFFVPLSWKDEMHAEASMPLPALAPLWVGSLLDAGGFDSGWDLKSSYGNRLGVSSVETGLGTQWMKIWSLNYEYRVRFGQDTNEESHWLKLGTSF